MTTPALPRASITLSLISHTNVGKTALARTLLRQDIGEIADRAHVTQEVETHILLETAQGETLRLADTPGFGDSVRLAKRLRQSGNPIGWFLTQVWDRFLDRALWGNQQAVRNMRDAADIVLYLVNAAEDPAAAGYVAPEMEILGWIGKPVVVLLNQLGPPRARELDARDVEIWRGYLARYDWVREVLPFDAFARCWVQEDRLLGAIEPWVAQHMREAFARLRAAWRERNRNTFHDSVAALVEPLVATAVDRETIAKRDWKGKTRALVASLTSGRDQVQEDEAHALDVLARRFDARLRASTDALIRLHGLSGRASAEVLARMQGHFALEKPADVAKAGVLGGLLSGAATGLAADLAAGGLTFGAGALIGGVLGALGVGGATRALNMARGLETGVARWSGDFLTARVESALLRYLAVAHFGRGRGDYVESEYPPHWRALATEMVEPLRGAFDAVWEEAGAGATPEALRERLRPIMTELVQATLLRLYPEAAELFSEDVDTGSMPPAADAERIAR